MVMAVCAVTAPFVYSQIMETNHTITDIAIAKNILSMRDTALNFVRTNQALWPDVAQIKLSDDELAQISDVATAGFIDKYVAGSASVTDVYLSFDTGGDTMRNTRIARHIGDAAAVVGADGIAYGNGWAVSAPEFDVGNLIYRVSRDFVGQDTNKYLHRGTSGEDDLNVMMRNLNMGGNALYDVGGVVADAARVTNGTAMFVNSDALSATNVYFSDGANMDGADVEIGSLRVSGDITGFRSIYADIMNGDGYTTSGRIIADRATVTNSVNVAHDFVIKSSSARSVSGFTAISTSTVAAPLISAKEIMFYDNFGLTVSGELLMSTTPPLRFGNWSFPSTTPPMFSQLKLNRATIPDMPNANDFADLMSDGWQDMGDEF